MDSFKLLREVTNEIFAEIKHCHSMQNLAVLFLGLQQNHMYTKSINFVLALVECHELVQHPQVVSFIQDTKSADRCSSVNKYRVIVGLTFVKAFKHLASF